MSKELTPRADALRAMREEKYGHIQATATPSKRKLIPFAGKEKTSRGPDKSEKPRKRRKFKRKTAP
jgi:hypothetical protein